jgi:hypothetical protein
MNTTGQEEEDEKAVVQGLLAAVRRHQEAVNLSRGQPS